jgi:hypothetical protein
VHTFLFHIAPLAEVRADDLNAHSDEAQGVCGSALRWFVGHDEEVRHVTDHDDVTRNGIQRIRRSTPLSSTTIENVLHGR